CRRRTTSRWPPTTWRQRSAGPRWVSRRTASSRRAARRRCAWPTSSVRSWPGPATSAPSSATRLRPTSARRSRTTASSPALTPCWAPRATRSGSRARGADHPEPGAEAPSSRVTPSCPGGRPAGTPRGVPCRRGPGRLGARRSVPRRVLHVEEEAGDLAAGRPDHGAEEGAALGRRRRGERLVVAAEEQGEGAVRRRRGAVLLGPDAAGLEAPDAGQGTRLVEDVREGGLERLGGLEVVDDDLDLGGHGGSLSVCQAARVAPCGRRPHVDVLVTLRRDGASVKGGWAHGRSVVRGTLRCWPAARVRPCAATTGSPRTPRRAWTCGSRRSPGGTGRRSRTSRPRCGSGPRASWRSRRWPGSSRATPTAGPPASGCCSGRAPAATPELRPTPH